MSLLAPKQKSTFKYAGVLIIYIGIPAHSVCGGRCPGQQGGTGWRFLPENGILKAPPWCQPFTRGVLINVGHFGKGPGEGPVLDPPFGRETSKCEGICHTGKGLLQKLRADGIENLSCHGQTSALKTDFFIATRRQRITFWPFWVGHCDARDLV